MKLSKNIILSCQILTVHKLRTILSVLGVVIGIASVIVMVSVGRGVEKSILNRIHEMGTNLIVVNAGQTRIMAGRQRQITNVITLVPADGAAIAERCSSVSLVALVQSKKLSVRWDAENTNTLVLGTTPEGFGIRDINIAWGRNFTDEENRARRRVAVLGPTVAQNLFGSSDPIGCHIQIRRVLFEVIGVTVPKGVDINGVDQDDLVFVPLGTAMRRLFNVTHLKSIYVRAKNAERLDEAETEIREVLRERHRLRNKPDDFTIQNQATLLATERETSQSLTLLIGIVAAISLLVGSVGILAVMLISVRERTPEIGLRRALGARQKDIATQFLLEAMILSGLGGLIGLISGLVISIGVSLIANWPIVILWPVFLGALVFSVAVGLFFGTYPARRASRLNPVEALRAE